MTKDVRIGLALPPTDRKGDFVLLLNGGETGAVDGGCHGFSVRKRAEETLF